MTWRHLEERLLTFVRRKVRRGEMSERGLAKLTGYTQPHIHNVVNGKRRLNSDLADALLRQLGLSAEELAGSAAPQASLPYGRGLAALRNGADGLAAVTCVLPIAVLADLVEPFLLQLGDDEDFMAPLLGPGDWIVLDRSEELRRRPVFECLYALTFGARGVVCRCQRVGGALVLVADNPHASQQLPDRVSLQARDILEIVQGKLVWAGRDLGAGVPML